MALVSCSLQQSTSAVQVVEKVTMLRGRERGPFPLRVCRGGPQQAAACMPGMMDDTSGAMELLASDFFLPPGGSSVEPRNIPLSRRCSARIVPKQKARRSFWEEISALTIRKPLVIIT